MFLAGVLLTASLAVHGALGQRRRDSISLQPPVCLSFDILCNVTDYEVRSCNQTTWAAVRRDPWFGLRYGFKSLLQYVQGANSQGVKLRMTSQFLTGNSADGPQVLYWLLPADLQDNPPQPNRGSNVFLTKFPQMYVYAKTVRTTYRELRAESRIFNRTLAEDNLNYNQSISYTAYCRRGPVFGRRRLRDAEELEQLLDTEPFESEEEDPGDLPLPETLRRRGRVWSRRRGSNRGRSRRWIGFGCFDLLFLSIGFPRCPIS